MQTNKENLLDTFRKTFLEEDEKKLTRLEKEFQELGEKHTALKKEQQNLRRQIDDKESLIESLEPVIADLLQRKIVTSKDEMADALAPIMGEAIKRQVAEAKDDVVDALYPVIGKAVRKSVAEAMKNLVNTVNKKIDLTLRRGLFKKRVQSKITGVSEAELILKDALPFRIEQIFIIHKSSGLLISHVSSKHATATVDEDLISGMLTAIKDFVSKAFKTDAEQDLNEIQYGDLKILLEMGHYSYLAVVISGIEPDNFQDELQKLNRKIHNHFFRQLRQFDGDMTKIGEIAKPTKKFLVIHNIDETPILPQKPKPYLIYFLAFALLIFFIMTAIIKLPDYFTKRKIKKINAKIESVQELKQQKIKYEISNKKITVSGNVFSLELKTKVDSLMRTVQGIDSVNNQLVILTPSTSSENIEQQIRQKMTQTEHLRDLNPTFIVEKSQVVIEGDVTNKNIKREIGYLVSEIPGVSIVINNLNILSIEKSREILHEITIYFGVDEIIISKDQTQKLNSVLELVKQLKNMKLSIKGYSDNLADVEYNLTLSKQRAQAVADYLISRDFPSENIITEYFGEDKPIASNDTEEGRAKNRRVEFDVIQER